LIIKDLYNSKGFLRWEEASEIGIDCGVGIPYTTGNDQTWVMTFLSAQATPIAKRFWVPDQARTALIFKSGDCSKNTDLASLYASKTIGKATCNGFDFSKQPRHSNHHCEPTGRANARPMTGSAKQSIAPHRERWIASAFAR